MKMFPIKCSMILSATCLILVFVGCKPSIPNVAGKWHGTATLTGGHSKSITADISLLLSQQGTGIHGDAKVVVGGDQAVHIPISTAVIDSKGRLALEGSANVTMGTFHFSFDGQDQNDTLRGKTALSVSNVLFGSAASSGPIVFAKTPY